MQLTYRGTAYSYIPVLSDHLLQPAPQPIDPLRYRGTTYQVDRSRTTATSTQPTVAQLRYRGNPYQANQHDEMMAIANPTIWKQRTVVANYFTSKIIG